VTFPVKKLGEVCSFVRGLTYSKSDEVEFSSNIVVRATNIDLSTHKLDFSELRYISDSIQVKDDKRLKKDDILICTASGSKSHLGKVAIVESDLGMAFGGFMGALRVNPSRITPQYLYTFLVSDEFKKHIESLSDGANINNLKFSQIENLEIPLPPITTQQKIVAKLDEIFDEIDKARAATEANAKNAEALFQSYLAQVFESTTDEWNVSELGKITKFIDYRGKTPTKTSDGIRLITAKNVKFGFLNKEPYEYIAEKDYEGWMTRGIPKKGDVLFTTEAPLANVAQLDTDEKVVFAQRLIILQPQEKLIDSEFLKFSLLSTKVQNQIISKGTGATVKGIKASLLKLIPIEYPSLKRQKDICQVLSDIKIESNKLKDYYTRKVSSLNLYKNSILKKAFSGELVKE
jgi:type I restriction enzyme S subunit